MVEIRLNGAPRTVDKGVTLAGLLSEMDLDPRWVLAELNGEAVSRERFGEVALASGDQLELVRPVAGG
jgi:thiamine biosynthesis protein ThiS